MLKILTAVAMGLSPMAALQTGSNHVSHRPFPYVPIPEVRVEEPTLEFSEDIPEEEKEQIQTIQEEEDIGAEVINTDTSEYSIAWDGQRLSPAAGAVWGPSGRETYYNLDMSGVISIARNEGIEGEYWVREDGAKMYGSYVICACGFDVRPRGTVIETSLGPGICLDTGGFAYTDPYQVDIATNW
jgi:hypothetical protein